MSPRAFYFCQKFAAYEASPKDGCFFLAARSIDLNWLVI
jgi:hypothetical protein